jgi:hypothetical protein
MPDAGLDNDRAYVEKVANILLTCERVLNDKRWTPFAPPDFPLAGWAEGDLFVTLSHELANDIGNQLSVIAKRMGGNDAETSTS